MNDESRNEVEIEITEAMLEAGRMALFGYDPEWDSSDEAVTQVFQAMSLKKDEIAG